MSKERPTPAEEAAAAAEKHQPAKSSDRSVAEPAPAAGKKTPAGTFDPTDPAQTRSGGPRVADPTVAPVDSLGNTPVHSPDLADNPSAPAAPPGGFGGLAPRDITKVVDGDDLTELLRTTLKADVLTYWRRQERAAQAPRQSVIDAINSRLLDVQGAPISDE